MKTFAPLFLGFALGLLSTSVYRSATNTWETAIKTVFIKNCVNTALFASNGTGQ